MARKLLVTLLFAAMGTLLPTASEAASVNNTAYLYAGPGFNYAKLLSVPGGANVGLGSCQGSWCQASYGGRNGWLSRSSLTGAVAGRRGSCRGGPSRCKEQGLSLNSFGLSAALGAASRNRRGRGNVGNNQAAPPFPFFNNDLIE